MAFTYCKEMYIIDIMTDSNGGTIYSDIMTMLNCAVIIIIQMNLS